MNEFLASSRLAAGLAAWGRAHIARHITHRAINGTGDAANAVRKDALLRALTLVPELIKLKRATRIPGFSAALYAKMELHFRQEDFEQLRGMVLLVSGPNSPEQLRRALISLGARVMVKHRGRIVGQADLNAGLAVGPIDPDSANFDTRARRLPAAALGIEARRGGRLAGYAAVANVLYDNIAASVDAAGVDLQRAVVQATVIQRPGGYDFRITSVTQR